MFFQLLYIHLFRPFLKYGQANSPLPAHVSPRKMCTHAAATISKLLRLYKRTYGLRQICNIAVYIAHSACTIHLLNLPEKNARRDIIHGVRQLEEIAESWLCARRTLSILSVQVRKWKAELPEEAVEVLTRTDTKFGNLKATDGQSPTSDTTSPQTKIHTSPPPMQKQEAGFSSAYGLSNGSTVSNLNQQRGVPPSTGRSTQPAAEYSPPSQQQSFVHPQLPKAQWTQTRPVNETNPQSHSSPSSLFGGVDSLLEESRDWWLKDQSTLFDSWPKQERGGILLGNGIGNSMNGLLPESVINGMGMIDDSNGNVADGMNYMGFGANAYGFNNGDLY